ncbi:MAG: HD domain-containing protein [Deltaproteobacteria bacterium]|nr:HD domain-containing protein [Deltaproteobacteria bacterium]
MPIRAKLLVLLLLIALLPLLVMAAFFLRTTEQVGEVVIERSRQTMTERELAYLEEKVGDTAKILRNHFALLGHLIGDQARMVEEQLAAELGPRAAEPSALHVAPGVDGAALGSDMARLAALVTDYASLQTVAAGHTVRHYTSLASGVHGAYPEHGGYPESFDPRERSWYRRALAADGVIWSLPYVDAPTGKLVTTVSAPVRGPGGSHAGVTAIDVSVRELFSVLASGPREWRGRSEAMIAGLRPSEDAGGEGVVVYARERYSRAGLRWDASVETEWIEDPSGEVVEQVSRLAAEGGVVMFRHPYRGSDSLWSLARVEEIDSLLLVLVPMHDVIARAQEMEDFVQQRLSWQASLAGVGLLVVAMLVALVAIRSAGGVTRPLAALSETARRIADGNLDSRADLVRNDEIGSLAHSVDDMADSIEKLMTAQEEAYLQSLRSLTKALETKDAYTAAHSGRVSHYSRRLGRRIGLDEATLELLGRGALMHDLGKIGIPESLLNKPASLDEGEFERMKEHPRFSAVIMRPLMRFREYAEIAAWHHERWDGKGYPDGLAGEEVPILARIVSIADTWDAMTGDRVYRKGMPVEKAVSILESELDSGQFDPELIRTFCEMIREEMQDPS